MRQSKKEIRDKTVVLELLNISHVGRLGTISAGGYPMVKPLNFVYHDENIYFHSAREGEKIEDIKRDARVCFEIDQPIALVKSRSEPCKAEYLYRSVIIKGKAQIVEDENERLNALKALMDKYQPEGGYTDFIQNKLGITAVVRIEIEEMTGKEDLGKGELKQATEKALSENRILPIILERK